MLPEAALYVSVLALGEAASIVSLLISRLLGGVVAGTARGLYAATLSGLRRVETTLEKRQRRCSWQTNSG